MVTAVLSAHSEAMGIQNVSVRCQAVPELAETSVALRRMKGHRKVTVWASMLFNTFYLPRSSPLLMAFGLKNHVPKWSKNHNPNL